MVKAGCGHKACPSFAQRGPFAGKKTGISEKQDSYVNAIAYRASRVFGRHITCTQTGSDRSNRTASAQTRLW